MTDSIDITPEPDECPHSDVRPVADDPGMGRCEGCGDAGFVLWEDEPSDPDEEYPNDRDKRQRAIGREETLREVADALAFDPDALSVQAVADFHRGMMATRPDVAACERRGYERGLRAVRARMDVQNWHGMVQIIDEMLAAATPAEEPDDCEVNGILSCACNRGTKGCPLTHDTEDGNMSRNEHR